MGLIDIGLPQRMELGAGPIRDLISIMAPVSDEHPHPFICEFSLPSPHPGSRDSRTLSQVSI